MMFVMFIIKKKVEKAVVLHDKILPIARKSITV
jgi:hypothetical protein